MAVTFESYERRIDQIKPVMEKYGIKDFEDALEICKEKGFNPYEIVKEVQPICFENAAWAYTLGAAIAAVSILLKQELLLVIIGLVYVIETLSVIIQVAYYKRTKKRLFKMAPIHHHFELCGWSEWKVVIFLWSVTLVCAAIGLVIAI